MFKRVFSWRLRRRQRALALAWCGDSGQASRLVEETRLSVSGFEAVEVYRRMAACCLQDGTDVVSASLRDEMIFADLPNDLSSNKVRQLILRMPMLQRMALSLVDIGRLDYRQTADVLGIGRADVQAHVVMARCSLLEAMRVDAEAYRSMDFPEPA